MGTETLELGTSRGRIGLADELRKTQLNSQRAFGEGPRSTTYQEFQRRIEGNISDAVAKCNGNLRERMDLVSGIGKIISTYPQGASEVTTMKRMLASVRFPLDVNDIKNDYLRTRSRPDMKIQLYARLSKAMEDHHVDSDEYKTLSSMATFVLGEACSVTHSDLMRVTRELSPRGISPNLSMMQRALDFYRSSNQTFEQLFF